MQWWPPSLLECVYGPSWLREVEWDKGKAGQLRNFVTYSYSLSVSLLLTQLHSFFLSFFSLAPTEAEERQVQCQKQCQNNTKKALELRETKKAKNDALVAQPIGVDAALRPDVVETIALKVVRKIENIVDEDGKV